MRLGGAGREEADHVTMAFLRFREVDRLVVGHLEDLKYGLAAVDLEVTDNLLSLGGSRHTFGRKCENWGGVVTRESEHASFVAGNVFIAEHIHCVRGEIV